MRNYSLLLFSLIFVSCSLSTNKEITTTSHPNIVIIYADDLGFGDMSAYKSGNLSTPNMDRIANEGIRFNNGYATSAACTPSRYGLLTGMYPWRNKNANVLPGDAPLLIDPKMPSLPRMLKNVGYETAVIGKWHLGMGLGDVDWNKSVTPSANDIGFDYTYLMAATNDRVPNVYVENGNVLGLESDDPLQVSYKSNFEGEPTGKDNPELLKMMYSHGHDNSINNGVSRIGYQKGGKSAQWIDENMADTFLVRAQQFVSEKRDQPFFLFYALHQPHVPRIPHPRFVGKTGMGPRGDVIAEADWSIGEFLKTLEEKGILDNTLIIFSSDNGPVLDDGYHDDSVEKIGDHTPWGPYRGSKYSLFNAGTNVPFAVMWRNEIKSGVSNALISQVDIYASLASLVGQEYPQKGDSQDMLDVLTGKSKVGREDLIIDAFGQKKAYRNGDWLLIPPYQGPAKPPWGVDAETGFSKEVQLYNVELDPKQINNVAEDNKQLVNDLLKAYHTAIQ